MVALKALLLCAVLAWSAPEGEPFRAPAKPVPGPLTLKAVAEPAVARPGQPVSVRIRWGNRSAAPIKLNRRGLLGREIGILVRRRGKPVLALQTPPDLGPPEPHDFQLLSPGNTFEYEYPILLAAGGFLAPGVYEIRVVYKNESPGDGAPPAWTGVLETSTKVTVRAK